MDALALYRGDLLAWFSAPDAAPEFEEWLDRERGKFRARAVEAAWSVAESAERDGDAGEAVRWGRWACDLSPDDELCARKLIQLHDRLGDRAGAIKAYDRLAVRLRKEYRAEPSPETRTLVEAVKSRDEERFAVSPGGFRW